METDVELCLYCEKNPQITEPCQFLLPLDWDDWDPPAPTETIEIYKFWDLCLSCWKRIRPEMRRESMGHWDLEVKFKKKYFEKYESYGVLKKVKMKPICLWYSVRPPNNMYTEREFIQRMEKFVGSIYITKGLYTFEWKYPNRCVNYKQRHSIHFHGLLYTKSMGALNQHIKRQPERYFNLIKDPKKQKQKFWIYTKEDYQDKIDYMNGKTEDEVKNDEKELDKESRKELGLKDVIEI